MNRVIKKHPYKTATFVSLIVIALLLSVLIGYGIKIRQLNNDLNGVGNDSQKQQTGLAWFPVKVYVQNALVSLYRNFGVVDAQTNRLYVPEMKVYVPLNELSRSLRYVYLEADQSVHQPTEAQFTTVSYLNRLPTSFDDVPCLQRLVTVGVNNKSNTDLTPAGDVKLQDARTLYFYKNTNPACKNFYPDNAPQRIIDVLKQAKSY